MKLQGTRFGTIEFEQEDVVTFSDGIIGFVDQHDFVLISTREEGPFRWLQSVQAPELAFLLADPNAYVDDYTPTIKDTDAQALNLDEQTPHLVFVTANIPKGKPEDMTLNLAGPIVINTLNRKGKQLVLDDQAYTIRHRVFEATQADSRPIAA